MQRHLLSQPAALQFLLGGNATFTLENTKTGNRFTFLVIKIRDDAPYFVKVLTGPNNDSYHNYHYIGVIKTATYTGQAKPYFTWGQKSKVSDKAQSVKVFYWLMDCLNNQNLPDFVRFYHEGKCGRCGRKLTVPESIMTGFGPECKNIMSGKHGR